jgi:hypothetical protein
VDEIDRPKMTKCIPLIADTGHFAQMKTAAEEMFAAQFPDVDMTNARWGLLKGQR